MSSIITKVKKGKTVGNIVIDNKNVYSLYEDDTGHEYYIVNASPYDIKEAIDSMINGKADKIITNNEYGFYMGKYVDEYYSNSVRRESIKKFKNVKYIYALKANGEFINIDDDVYCPNKFKSIMLFDTEIEAKQHLDKCEKIADKYANIYNKYSRIITNDCFITDLLLDQFNEIQSFIIRNMFFRKVNWDYQSIKITPILKSIE